MVSRNRLAGEIKTIGLFQGLRDAFQLLTRSEKTTASFLVLSMNINAVLGLVGLAGILPFVQLMLEPAPLEGNGRLARVLSYFSITNVDHALLVLGLVLIGLVLAKNLYAFFHTGLQNRFCARVETRLSTGLLDAVVRAPYAWLVKRNSAVLRDIVTGQSIELTRSVIRTALQVCNDILFLIVAFGLLVLTSPAIGLSVVIAAFLLAGALLAMVRPRIGRTSEYKRRAIRIAGVVSNEAISGGRDVRISGAGPLLVSVFEKEMKVYASADSRGRQWQLMPRLGLEVISFGALVVIALGAIWSGTARTEVAALLALYAVVAMRAVPVVSQVAVAISALTSSMPTVAEVKALSTELKEFNTTGESSARSMIAGWRRLQLECATFKYEGSVVPAVAAIDLVIERGRSYGIVGGSGAGKSTLIDMIAGLLRPTDGAILLDGERLDGGQLSQWRERVAYVTQTPFLIDATLADNIEFGQPHHSDRRLGLENAIKAAGLREFVDGLPQGIDTPLGERGMLLSGGQRQRVAIARAFYRDADLLILDEATSALDSLTEREITNAIAEIKERLTLIVVAHRLSTVMHCDEIAVLTAGRVTGRGTHQELLASDTSYRQMVEAQTLPTSLRSVRS